MRPPLILLAPVLVLAACQPAATPPASDAATATTPAPTASATVSADNGKPASPTPADPAPKIANKTDDCGASKVRAYVGRQTTPDLRAEVEQKSGARTTRWIMPGMMVTEDYRPDRLNAHLGTDNKIGSFSCY